jgi:hypothetical protein
VVEHDSGNAGGERGIIGVADANAGDVGQEILQDAELITPGNMSATSVYEIATERKTLAAERDPDHPGKLSLAVRLDQEQHAGIQAALVDDDILGIA